MKYNVVFPKPKNKNERKLIISMTTGWKQLSPTIIPISPEMKGFVFEIDDEFEYARNKTQMDGPVFDVCIEYMDKEKKYLVPQKES